ncbi:MAG: ferredoxin family protein [Chloroherpetonaceae bacterium]|jgi:2-oxoglutarate ferredoxin oxidoreductase subunit delta|nr:ferredoxin family protein [bacterium]
MAKALGEIIIDKDICKGCELCVDACPEKTLALSTKINSKGYNFVIKVQDNCTGCMNCALICPDSIFTVYRKIVR